MFTSKQISAIAAGFTAQPESTPREALAVNLPPPAPNPATHLEPQINPNRGEIREMRDGFDLVLPRLPIQRSGSEISNSVASIGNVNTQGFTFIAEQLRSNALRLEQVDALLHSLGTSVSVMPGLGTPKINDLSERAVAFGEMFRAMSPLVRGQAFERMARSLLEERASDSEITRNGATRLISLLRTDANRGDSLGEIARGVIGIIDRR